MKRKAFIAVTMISVIAVVVFAITRLTSSFKDDDYFRINPAFRHYISGFTSGIVSTDTKIIVKLAFDYAEEEMFGNAVEENLFSFKPHIDGQAFWTDKQTIEFRPAQKLPHDETYKIDFNLSKLLTIPDSLSVFKFHIRTMKQALNVEVLNVKPYDAPQDENYRFVKIIGQVNTADFVEQDKIERVISTAMTLSTAASHKIKWERAEGSKTHKFEVDSIERKAQDYTIILSYDGKPIGAKEAGSIEVNIPGTDNFKVMDAKASQFPDQHIVIQFSDPLDNQQEIEGLIQMSGTYRSLIEDNEIIIYPSNVIKGGTNIVIHKSIRNSKGENLDKSVSKYIVFDEIKPNVRLIGKGVIVPTTNGLVFPFEAVNLKAVNVKIIRVFEDNILQFLQVNEIDGKKELKRVGRQVFNKTIELTGEGIVDYSQWNTFSLNLEELIKTEPGAIYQINITFTKEHSAYPCTGDSDEKTLTNFSNASQEDASDDVFSDYYYDYYDYYDYYYYDYYDDGDYYYNWSDKEDPCKKSYYYNKGVSRNFIASNLGIIAKKGSNENLHVFITDLTTAEPISNVKIEIYNQQSKLLASENTNNNGMAVIKMDKVPAFLVAIHENQRGYLKLNPATALSLSVFDISGSASDNNIKGFLYGERGVWRPGDSLYLTFILEDRDKKLPASHPVAFTLTNPMGQVTYRTVKTNGLNGFYNFGCVTANDAPTGNWNATVDVGGARFSKTIKIETVMPNRLKINIDFGCNKLFAYQDNKILLQSAWLHGAPAKNLKADVKVVLSKMKTEFKTYKNYIFDDNSREFYTEEYDLFSGRLDENGEASFSPEINLDNTAPGALRASFQVRVFENSGAFSIDRETIPYYPFKSYVGIKLPKGSSYSNMLHTDKTHKIEIVNVDANGSLIKNSTILAEVYKLDWNWWYDYSGEGGGSYINSYYMSPITTEEIELVNGKGAYSLKINYPDWGRYYVRISDNESGHSAGEVVYIDYPEWEGRSRMRETSAATLLTLTTDKQFYNVGDKIEVTFPSAKGGRALVSIEKGSKILKTYWVKTDEGHTSFKFDATPEMTPNMFAHVTFIQPHQNTVNDLPIRLYGVVPINVEDKNTILKPVISMPDVLKPEQKATITVSEENKKAMTYTLAIVDEGLLDLTRFKTPNPWAYFYAKEALGIKTWDLYDYVAGAYAGKLAKLLNIGGDDEIAGEGDLAKANRFKPMVRFVGPFSVKKGKTQQHQIDIPNYVGSVRVMLIAGQDAAYGHAEKTVAVRNPLMILGTLPRVMGPDETVELPVSVFAMENQIKNVTVEVKTNNLFTIDGESKKSVSFTQTGDKMLNFRLKTSPSIGVGNVKIIATSGNHKAAFDIEIDVRNPNPKVVDVIDFIVEPGKTLKKKFKTTGIAGTNKGKVEISAIPPINLEKRLGYLIAYPHGCLEQTTSGAFPQLYLENILELSNEQKDKIQMHINAAIKKIASMQISNGGLTYWQGANYTDDWATNYSGHFMLEAAEKGYKLPTNFVSNFIKYQKNMANKWVPNTRYYNSDLIQSYRLYTLALAKAPELGAMNRLKEQKDLTVAAKWRLAAAYQLAGQNATAIKMINNLSSQITSYKELSYTYGSSIRDMAMILETLTLLKQKTKAAEMAKTLSASMASDEWMSTQTTAYALLAISKYYKAMGVSSDMNYSIKTKNIQTAYTGKAFVNQADLLLRGKISNDILEVQNKGKAVIFGRIIMEGIPRPGEEKATENSLKINVSYTDVNGTKINVDKIEQGTDFIAAVSVTNPGLKGEYKELALSHIVPPGWEIHNTRMDEGSSMLKMAPYNYMDIRDDRIYLYFNLQPTETKLFQFMFNASYVGKYYLPAIYTEAMYDATINAKVPGKWVEISKEK